MKETLKILLIDDHPFSIDGYKNIIELLRTNNELNRYTTDEAYCCESALQLIQNNIYDLVLLDISLPPSKNGLFQSGEDLGRLILKKYPETKIIVITGFHDPLVLNNILHTISPKGFLFRGNVSSRILSAAILKVLNGKIPDKLLFKELINQARKDRVITNKNFKTLS